jgi:hypothetical protein
LNQKPGPRRARSIMASLARVVLSMSGPLRGSGFGGQLGPDSVPVIRPQLLPGDSAGCLTLDSGTVLDGNAPNFPVADGCGRYPQPLSKHSTATEQQRRLVKGMW